MSFNSKKIITALVATCFLGVSGISSAASTPKLLEAICNGTVQTKAADKDKSRTVRAAASGWSNGDFNAD